ncbi:hypothetical protein CFC21_043537 [Triticum aestivum]|uniref:RING-type domain-containing protein n=3 Tax=Triticum TaxID=4564 RepID=A0A9R1S753_TRITD|nr:hypothetical protein CFC21_043537 [Triticum aestivum]VAH83634.1 unnamed protein product [Triticum turgidum subsp. durum]
MNARQTAQVNQVVGAVGMPPPQSQTQDAWVDSQFVMMRGNAREKIFEYIGRKPSSADWRRRLPHLARRLEEILFRKYPSKREYYNMMKGQIEPHLQFAIKELSAQNQQRQRNQQLSRQIASSPGYGTMILTPGQAPNQHVNTLLSLGMNSTHHDRPRACNNNLVIDTVDTPATNRLLESHAPLKEVRKEPKFSCPVCMNELVDASSTICGHIFCQKCIQASIQAQSKCPTCRRTLTMNSFHRVYLPTMD